MNSAAQYGQYPSVNGVIAAIVLQENLTKFIDMIQPAWLATNLFEKTLLSQPILKKVLNSPDSLAEALLESIETIKRNGDKFNDMLMILDKESVYKSLAETLKTEYEEKLKESTLPTIEKSSYPSGVQDKGIVSGSRKRSRGIDTPSKSNVPLQNTLGDQQHVHVQHLPVIDTQVSGASSLIPNSRLISLPTETAGNQMVTAPFRPMDTTIARPSFLPSQSYHIPYLSTTPQVNQSIFAPQSFAHHNSHVYDLHFHGNPIWNIQDSTQPMNMPQTDLCHPTFPYSMAPVQTSSSSSHCRDSSVHVEHVEIEVKHKTMAKHEEELKAKYIEMAYPILIPDSTVNEYFDLFMIDTKERVYVNIEDIGKLPDGSQAQCILVEGESGAGKTMLLHHLAKQWAAGKIFTQYKLVLLHTLLETVSKYEFVELLDINSSYSDQDCDDLKLEIGKGKDLLFLLDAYNHPLSDIQCAMQFFPEASLIFTCPSERVDSIRELIIKYTEQYLKVIGFTFTGSEAYIAASLPHDLRLDFSKWIAHNRFGLALTYRPLYCMMLMELCLAKELPDSLPNLTDLYKLFILCIISKHIGKDIEGYSDLQEHDIDQFLSVASSATSEGALPISVEQSFGLTKCLKPFCSKDFICIFKHSSIQDYFLALYICLISAKEKLENGFPNPIPYSVIRFVVGLGRARDIYFICNEMGAKREELCLQLFETKSPSFANYVCDSLCNCKFVWALKLEADPLHWYIFGWCLQSCELQWTLTYDVEKFFHTPLCLKMLYDGCNSSKSNDPPIEDGSVSFIVKLVKINFNGGSQLCESLCKLSLLKSYTLKVKELNLSGTLDCNGVIDGLEFDKYMPNLEILSINCQSSFGLPWIPMINSLPRLEHLSTLRICGANTQDISKALSSSIKACKSLHKLHIENVLSEVLEDAINLSETDLMMSLLGCINIIGSSITEVFVEKIGYCLAQQICRFRKLVLGKCSIHKVVLKTMLKNILCSEVKTLCLYGINSVGNEGAHVIADVIRNTPVEWFNHKTLFLHDTTISKSAMEQVINATSENKGIDLYIPIKYKFDFMSCKDILYISDSQLRNYIST